MTPLKEIIEDLDAAAEKFTYVALAVGFEHTTSFIWPHDPNRAKTLAEAIAQGGQAIGFIAFQKTPGLVTVCCRTLDEYTGVEWAGRYLERLVGNVAKSLQLQTYERLNEWPN